MRKLVKRVNWLFLIIILIYIVLIYSLSFISRWVSLGMYGSMILSQLMLIIPGGLFFVITKTRPDHVFAFRRLKWTNVLMLIAFTYAVMPLTTLVNYISSLFASSGNEATTQLVNNISLIPGILLIALVPAVVEEFLFRGIFYGAYRKCGILLSALMSGLLFGLMHMNFNQFSYAFVLGIICCLVIEATGTLLAPMIVHFVFNANSVIMAWLLKVVSGDAASVLEQSSQAAQTIGSARANMIALSYYTPMAIAGCIVALFLYRRIAKSCHRLEHTKVMLKVQSDERMITVPVIIAMIICVAFMFLTEL